MPGGARLTRVSTQERLPIPSARAPGTAVTLEGVLERVTFANEDNAWSVVRIAVPEQASPITAVGNLLGVKPGENLKITGRWVNDKKYGDQFQIDSFQTVVPITLAGIERYLGSGMVRGIGKVMAERLVKRFGLRTLEVIDQHPERLSEVEGIGRVRREQITHAWNEQRAIKDVMVFLQSHGVATSHAVKIYKRYEARAISVVRDNPYRLATDIFGIGFHTADTIAKNLGILPTSPERIAAGVLQVLATLSDEGHVAALHHDLVERTGALLQIDTNLVAAALLPEASLVRDGAIVVERGADADEVVYLRDLHAAELGTAELVARLLRAAPKPLTIDVARAIAWFETSQAIVLADEQRQAITLAVKHKVLVLTGGPGTGKTTLINGIIQIFEKKGHAVLLAAPTGRARQAHDRDHRAAGQDAAPAPRIQPALQVVRARSRKAARDRSAHRRRGVDDRHQHGLQPGVRAPRSRRASSWWATSTSSRRWDQAACSAI